MTNTATTTRPAVLDSKDQPLELRMRVKVLKTAELGTIVNIEWQRSRVVIKLDSQEKLIVRPSAAVMIKKSRSGKIERVAKAVRAGRATASADA